MINDILFQSLNPFQFLHFNNTASSFFKVDFSKVLKENDCVAESLGKKITFTYSNPWDDDNIDVTDEEEPMDEEQAEGEGEEFDADFIDEVLGGADENGRAVEADELRAEAREAREAPAAWHPYVIDHDEVLRPTNDTVRGMRDELDRLTAELASTITVDNTNNMIYYDLATLRGAMAEATRGAVATDDGEGHG